MFKAKPVIIKKNRILKDNLKLLCCINNITQEDVIYKATPNDFLKGKYPNLVILNKYNKLNNSSLTIARYSASNINSSVVELTSEPVVKLIGQKNYDAVFTALCSVISQELRIQGILALLTNKQFTADKSFKPLPPEKSNAETQTDQSCMSLLMKEKCRKKRNRIRCHAKPYVVKDNNEETQAKAVNKVVVYPKIVNTQSLNQDDLSIKIQDVKEVPELLDLKQLLDEDSIISNASTSNWSISTDKITNFILNNVMKCEKPTVFTTIPLFDGTTIRVNAKIEDDFHLVSEDILRGMPLDDQKKLLIQQTYIDLKHCLERDEDNNLCLCRAMEPLKVLCNYEAYVEDTEDNAIKRSWVNPLNSEKLMLGQFRTLYESLCANPDVFEKPIHQAVLEDDTNLLKRQCIILNNKCGSVDEFSGSGLTALQMSIFLNSLKCMEVLLNYGADVMVTDNEGRTAFHQAAEKDSGHLNTLIEHCRKNSRRILMENEDIWEANWDKKSDEELCEYLLYSISIKCDAQGYTPLMLASKFGIENNVKVLIDISPNTINKTMPNSGNTALYLAVGSACSNADSCGDRSKVADNYLKTIEMLIVNGADPYLQNDSGSSVNDLLSEFNIDSLSLLIANKLTSVKFFNGDRCKNFDQYMLVKKSDGHVDVAEIKKQIQEENEVIPPKTVKTGKKIIVDLKKNIPPSELKIDSSGQIHVTLLKKNAPIILRGVKRESNVNIAASCVLSKKPK